MFDCLLQWSERTSKKETDHNTPAFDTILFDVDSYYSCAATSTIHVMSSIFPPLYTMLNTSEAAAE